MCADLLRNPGALSWAVLNVAGVAASIAYILRVKRFVARRIIVLLLFNMAYGCWVIPIWLITVSFYVHGDRQRRSDNDAIEGLL